MLLQDILNRSNYTFVELSSQAIKMEGTGRLQEEMTKVSVKDETSVEVKDHKSDRLVDAHATILIGGKNNVLTEDLEEVFESDRFKDSHAGRTSKTAKGKIIRITILLYSQNMKKEARQIGILKQMDYNNKYIN